MRRLRALIAGLPRTAALWRNQPEAQWDTTAELLASLIEVVDTGNRYFVMANTKKGTKAPKPIEIRRPGMAEPPALAAGPVSMSSPEARAFFGGGEVIYTPTEN